MSLLYRLLRCLFGLLAVLVRSDLSKDIELQVLRHENQVLRRRLSGHDPALAPCPRRPQVDLYRPAPARTTVYRYFGQDADHSDAGRIRPGP